MNKLSLLGFFPIGEYRKQFDLLLSVYADAVQKYEEFYRDIGLGIKTPPIAAGILVAINAQIAANPHLAAVELFILKYQLGFGGSLLAEASDKLLERNPENPFFIYVAKGNSDPHRK